MREIGEMAGTWRSTTTLTPDDLVSASHESKKSLELNSSAVSMNSLVPSGDKSTDEWLAIGKWHKRATLVLMLLVILLGSMFSSVLAPFFPQESKDKGLTATQSSLVISVFSIVMFVVSPVFGNYLNRIGPKLIFVASTFTAGFSTIAFGTLDYTSDPNVYLGVAYATRIVGALGDAGVLVAGYALLPRMYPQNVASVSGAVESAYAIGLMAGPLMGGALKEVGGFPLPFYVIGGVTCFMGLVCLLVLPNSTKGAEPPQSVRPTIILQFMKLPFFWLCAFVQLAAATSLGFLTAILDYHMEGFGLSDAHKGLVFSVNGLVYMIFATIIGKIADKHGGQRYICVIGLFLVGVSYLLFGPAPFIPVKKELWVMILALGIHGAGWAHELVGSISGMIVEVVDKDSPESVQLVGFVSGIFNAVFNLGSFIGPTVGGPLYDNVGFPWASMSIFFLQVVLEIALITMLIVERKRRRRQND